MKKNLGKNIGENFEKKIWEKIVPLYDCEKIIKSLNFRGELISMPSHLDHQTTISNPWRKFVHEVMNFHGLFMNVHENEQTMKVHDFMNKFSPGIAYRCLVVKMAGHTNQFSPKTFSQYFFSKFLPNFFFSKFPIFLQNFFPIFLSIFFQDFFQNFLSKFIPKFFF